MSQFGYGAPASTCSSGSTRAPARRYRRPTARAGGFWAYPSYGVAHEARTPLAFVDTAEVVPPSEVRAGPAGTAAAIGAVHGGDHAPHAGS
ncbi:hypothetical protein OG568_17860 [Streptomyces sp. NBC_01450]|uniref:hypothetical protein n=1 Tax=Streptomyces sp. NBC_01450 TaxID=2903871 RepID=UPI002E36E062|nr:hypothetical protein [Streptomyces sp. NBC_01450]